MKGKQLFMKELNDKTVKELVQLRKELKEKLYSFKMKNAIKGLKQTHQIGDLKIKIARINTILSSKIKEKYGDNMK
ncbi:MAG: 50S ribosomal protein L29 [Candidatus Absconditabacterales bacterium]